MPTTDLPTKSCANDWTSLPLAIVGMACRLPGGDGVEEFWETVSQGRSAITLAPPSKLDRELYFDPKKGTRGKTYTEIGGFVSSRGIDWSLLNVTPSEANEWDECHLNFYEIAAKACRDAGWDPRQPPMRRVGVFVGHSGGSTLGGELAYGKLADRYAQLLETIPGWKEVGGNSIRRELVAEIRRNRPVRQNGKPWVDASFAAGLVSRAMEFDGPHMSIDAACASSLVALALASLSLHAGESEAAIVGGASFNKADSCVLFSHAQSCSATGSRPFDQAADGLVSSEGYVALVVKTLEQAQRDGDRIHAVVRGIGISSDGRGKSLWAPRKEGQLTAIQRAYANGIRPDSIQMVEAHATSTRIGDATEMQALQSFYRQHIPAGTRIPVGSVKSNIGHTLETAGLAGLLKSVLSIQNGVIPPTINVTHPSSEIDWKNLPLEIAQHPLPWPQTDGQPRRAAVNAFGIGGLNVHVVVEQANPLNQSSSTPRVNFSAQRKEPIAVVGRGIIVPGAFSLTELQGLASGDGKIETRRDPSGHLLGVVDSYAYDWRKHRVPPKQIDHANPLQFRLLDAAHQALQDAGLIDASGSPLESPAWNRKRTAVVVGSVFGGDFGNDLFAGLRLPEFRSRLVKLLINQGQTRRLAEEMAEAYESAFLTAHPALLDETGSFTSSTLASRIAKTYNLMGGALAIDAGDASGIAALNVASQLLRSETVDYVLCAAAHRAFDLAALDNLTQMKRLAPANAATSSQDTPEISEGVALVVLCRESVARDLHHVHRVIRSCTVSSSPRSVGDALLHASSAISPGPRPGDTQKIVCSPLPNDDSLDAAPTHLTQSSTIARLGELHSVQPLAELICDSVTPEGTDKANLLAAYSHSGQAYVLDMAAPAGESASNPSAIPDSASAADEKIETMLLSADSAEHLKQQLSAAFGSKSGPQVLSPLPGSTSAWRAAIVASREQLPAKASRLAAILSGGNALPMQSGVLWSPPTNRRPAALSSASGGHRERVAWAFPGQGSQYAEMLKEWVNRSQVVRRGLDRANTWLDQNGLATFEQMAWNGGSNLGRNIWQTQASMLVADWLTLEAIREQGHLPDIVLGHSYGEFAALVAAGCWELETALDATRARCDIVARYAIAKCGLLSVMLDASSTADQLEKFNLASADTNPRSHLAIAIVNTPHQTIVGGPADRLDAFSELLTRRHVKCSRLAVPTAFHTPMLAACVGPFRDALKSFDLVPPTVPFLSSVGNRFLADPSDIVEALARQLAEPLDFAGAIRRLQKMGVAQVIEVGPQRVLSNLISQTAPAIRTLPIDCQVDGISTTPDYPFALLSAADFVFGGKAANLSSKSGRSARQTDTNRDIGPVLEFDATQLRRQRLRLQGQSSDMFNRPQAGQVSRIHTPLHYDATGQRKQTLRSQAEQSSKVLASFSTTHSPATAVSAQAINGSKVEAKPEQNTSARSGAADILMDLIVEQTGYPLEIIQLDWDFEADLGIDSIKKAQIFGELREFFDMEALTALKLDDFRTPGDVVTLLRTLPGKADWAAVDEPPQSHNELHTAPPHSCQADPVSQCNTRDANRTADHELPTNHPSPVPANHAVQSNQTVVDVQQLLLDFITEQTGFPEEIISLDADLEADLGIDSIKKAQLLGELSEAVPELFVGETESTRSMLKQLDGLRTIADILAHVSPNTATHALASSLPRMQANYAASSIQETNVKPSIAAVATEPRIVQQTEHSTKLEPQTVADFLIDFVVEQTGYPREIVELDIELEADLGIDSIKKAQMLGEVREAFGIELSAGAVSAGQKNMMSQIGTLRQIINFVCGQQAATQSSLEEVEGHLPENDDPAESSTCSRIAAAPLLLWDDRAGPRNEIIEATRKALATMVARSPKSGRPPTHSPLRNGKRNALNTLSGWVGVPEQSIYAFDQLTQCESSIHLADVEVATHAESQLNHPCWFLDFELPTWLSNATFSLRYNCGSTLASIAQVGCTSNAVTINTAGVLVATEGTIEDNWLPTELRHGTLAEIQSSIQQLVAVPPVKSAVETRKLIIVDSTSGDMVSMQWDGLQWRATCGYPSRRFYTDRSTRNFGRIGLDVARRQFVVRTGDNKGWRTINLDYLTPAKPLLAPATCQTTAPETTAIADDVDDSCTDHQDAEQTIARRHILRMVPSPRLVDHGLQPRWSGSVIVVGDNPIARQLVARLRGVNLDVHCFLPSVDPEQLAREFEHLASDRLIPHLFIASPCDPTAETNLDADDWSRRRKEGLLGNFWLCQRWLSHVLANQLGDQASLIAVSSMGGSFGLTDELGRPHIFSVEGGGLGGMLKSILIESWMLGLRSIPIKTIDTAIGQPPAEVVDCIWQELAQPSYDNEVSCLGGSRRVVRAFPRPAPARRTPVPSGSTWVCTGGARGITAFVAQKLALRYGLNLHLLGTTSLADFDPAWRDMGQTAVSELKKVVMMQARNSQISPMLAWQNVEKKIEIDATLRQMKALGVQVHYHVCNVADRRQVHETLEEVRRLSGPIHGVLHGAGVGRDARFDRKQPQKVDQCIAAKVDGGLALMDATQADPLQYFVGFGSISGRFGANGHTDYSLANDMLCKQIDWLKSQRPAVKAIGFHWHAWGDVGMATKPETKLALEMIDMQFMPAEEGFEHLINELECESGETEVLITDERYYRMFYPTETRVLGRQTATLPLEASHCSREENKQSISSSPNPRPRSHSSRSVSAPAADALVGILEDCDGRYGCPVNPARDPFLTEHLLDGRPLMPFVVGTEILRQAAELHSGIPVHQLFGIEALAPMRFFNSQEQVLPVSISAAADGAVLCELKHYHIASSGHRSDRAKVHFVAESKGELVDMPQHRVRSVRDIAWTRASYPGSDNQFYVGPPLQRLRRYWIGDEGLVGQIAAPALIELASGRRDTSNWRTPSAAMDACLFAIGILAWNRIAPGVALPVRIGTLSLGRLPRPGELLELHAVLRHHSSGSAEFDFSLFGIDGGLILSADEYRIAWLGSSGIDVDQSKVRAGRDLRVRE